MAVLASGALLVALISLLLHGLHPVFYFGLAASCIASMALMISNGVPRGE